MPHQPNLFPSNPTSGSAGGDRKPVPSANRVPLWLRCFELFLYVVLRIYIGIVILVLPWTPLWTENHLLNYFPRVSALLAYGAVRGIVSGLGLLNLWIAVDEAVHYRESRF